jgi:hypothetical protein
MFLSKIRMAAPSLSTLYCSLYRPSSVLHIPLSTGGGGAGAGVVDACAPGAGAAGVVACAAGAGTTAATAIVMDRFLFFYE